jgi:hypothetical protein
MLTFNSLIKVELKLSVYTYFSLKSFIVGDSYRRLSVVRIIVEVHLDR